MRETVIVARLGRKPYRETYELQKDLQGRRLRGEIPDCLLLVEHPPTYTIGRGGGAENLLVREALLKKRGFEIYHTDRGGDITYHGPGQLVGYPILDLRRRDRDLHRYLRDLEGCLIQCLAGFGVRGERLPGLTGVWVNERKIASLGVRVVRWVTMHGFALNVSTDLEAFRSIVPCGIRGCRLITLEKLLKTRIDLDTVADRFEAAFTDIFHLSASRVEPESLMNRSLADRAPLARVAGF